MDAFLAELELEGADDLNSLQLEIFFNLGSPESCSEEIR
jgi:hypothetical protein